MGSCETGVCLIEARGYADLTVSPQKRQVLFL